ncbi:hypothetical protein DFH06DRAFT_1471452 [Mycena polygramma]|nr:hypothetical protein DFH06DRAFT_1471452 [Mycena polygramma]
MTRLRPSSKAAQRSRFRRAFRRRLRLAAANAQWTALGWGSLGSGSSIPPTPLISTQPATAWGAGWGSGTQVGWPTPSDAGWGSWGADGQWESWVPEEAVGQDTAQAWIDAGWGEPWLL